jgi:hypothetical protein
MSTTRRAGLATLGLLVWALVVLAPTVASGPPFPPPVAGQNVYDEAGIWTDATKAQAEGIIDAKGQVKGHGFTPEALRTNLVGNADINITGAKLKDLNVLKTVLDSLSVIPGLGASLEAGLPEAYKQKLAQKDTSFNDIKVPVTIVSGKVVISETTISSEGMFTFQAKGDAGFDGSYSLEGTFLLPADLSRAMAGSVAQMQYLMNPEGMIFIPLKVSGKAGARMQFTVDAAYITRKLLENQAQQQIMKGLNRIFGGQDQPQQPGSSGQPQPSQQSEENNGQDPGKAVGDLLHGLFGK